MVKGMALVKCPDCGKMVSSRAPACPECGCPSDFFIDKDKTGDIAGENESVDLPDNKKKAILSDSNENSTLEDKTIICRGKDFVIIEPVGEVLKRAIEAYRDMNKHQEEKKKINKKIEELDSCKKQREIYDVKRYEEAKRIKKLNYEEKIKIISGRYYDALSRFFNLCSYINISSDYKEGKALVFIYDKMSSSHCSLQVACEAYEKQLQLETQRKQLEEERRRRAEEAQRERSEEQHNRNYRIVNSNYQNEVGKYRCADDYDDYNAGCDDQYCDYDEESSRGSVLGGFIRDVAATAIGSSIANRGIKKELRRQREEEERREKERKNEEDKRKREAAHRSQIEWENVRRTNEERRRKGQPELPYPHRFYW